MVLSLECQWIRAFGGALPCSELGKVTFKNIGDEALSDESPLKNNSDEAFNNSFP